MMVWHKNSHGGYRNEDNTLYLQQTPKRYYQVFRCVGNVWSMVTREPFPNVTAAKAYAEALP